MRAGRKRERVRIERPVQNRDAQTGAISNDWEIVATRWANIAPLNGSEQAFLGSEITEANSLVVVRYDRSMKDITGEWRIVDARNGRIYDIEYFDPITSALRDLKIRCVHRSK